ncbi:MAG: hypothetical protein WBN96_04090, partial [Gammaproteobacteria bacterium]
MSEIIKLAENHLSKKDHERLASFGGHVIAHGRATRWHFSKGENGAETFEIFRGGADEVMAVCVSHDRKTHAFYALDELGNMVASGELDHVMAELEQHFI